LGFKCPNLVSWKSLILVFLLLVATNRALASVNVPLHHWVYGAIAPPTALGVIDRAMVLTKPYSRKEAAQYVARAIRRIRDDRVPLDGREVLAEPLLDTLMTELHPSVARGLPALRLLENTKLSYPTGTQHCVLSGTPRSSRISGRCLPGKARQRLW